MTSRGRDKHSSVIHAADRIRRLGFGPLAAMLLEAGRPLALLTAQMVWLTQPVLGLVWPRHELAGAAEILEDPESLSALIALLDREPDKSGGGP